jgi:two-component system, NarL family, nitrate/nitrite response regulator NarL
MMTEEHTKRIVVCDTQPIVAEGLRNLLGSGHGLEFTGFVDSLEAASQFVRFRAPELVLVDKGFGMQMVLDWLHDLRVLERAPAPIVWGVSMTEAESVRLLQAGARGVLRKTAGLQTVAACLTTVAEGRCWMEDPGLRDPILGERNARTDLTAREHQVLELVEQGFKNKEIATELGIRPGTVKIHLKHIFEKTGVRGRYGLALSGLKEKGVVCMAS